MCHAVHRAQWKSQKHVKSALNVEREIALKMTDFLTDYVYYLLHGFVLYFYNITTTSMGLKKIPVI